MDVRVSKLHEPHNKRALTYYLLAFHAEKTILFLSKSLAYAENLGPL